MMVNGGTFLHYESRKMTHTIATNLPDSKVRFFAFCLLFHLVH